MSETESLASDEIERREAKEEIQQRNNSNGVLAKNGSGLNASAMNGREPHPSSSTLMRASEREDDDSRREEEEEGGEEEGGEGEEFDLEAIMGDNDDENDENNNNNNESDNDDGDAIPEDQLEMNWKPERKRVKLGNEISLEIPLKYDYLKYDCNLPGMREIGLPEIMRNNAGHIDYRTISQAKVDKLYELLTESDVAEIPFGERLRKKREEDRVIDQINGVKRRRRIIEVEKVTAPQRAAKQKLPPGEKRRPGPKPGAIRPPGALRPGPKPRDPNAIPTINDNNNNNNNNNINNITIAGIGRNFLKMTASGIIRSGNNNLAPNARVDATTRMMTKFTPCSVQEAAARSNAPLIPPEAYWFDQFARIEMEEIRRLSKEQREAQRSQATTRKHGIREELQQRREIQAWEYSEAALKFVPSEEKPKETYREQLWRRLAIIEIPGTRTIQMLRSDVEMRRARLLAHICAVEVTKRNKMKEELLRQTPSMNLRKLSFAIQTFWRAADRQAEDAERLDKIRQKQLKIEMERRQEARMQEQRLQFLLNQSELYAHFITKKSTEDEEEVIKERTEAAIAKAAADNPNSTLSEEERTKIAEEAKKSALEEMRKTKLKMDEFDQATNEQLKKNKVEEKVDFQAMDVDKIEQPKMLNATLKQYQLEGLRWIANLYNNGINGILADEMGLGKTVQSIALLAHLAETKNLWGPFLVAAPTSTLPNWCTELQKFIPAFNVIPYWGGQEERRTLRQAIGGNEQSTKDATCHVFVTSYDLLLKDEKYLNRIKWQYMVLDEAQAIKNSSSLRWKSLLGFKCRNRLLLTGTPVQNTMQELWALLHFIMPTLFDSHEQFSEWFSKGVEGSVTDGKELNENQLQRLHAVLKPFMLRRLKTDVLGEMAAKEEHVVKCALSRRQKEMYKRIKKSVAMDALISGETSPIGTIIQLRKVCSHPDLVEFRSNSEPFAFSRLGGKAGCYIARPPSSDDGQKTKGEVGMGGPRLNINALLGTAEPLIDVRVWRSELEVVLPKLAFRDFGLLFSGKDKILRNSFNVIDSTSFAKNKSGGLMGCLRLHNTAAEWAKAVLERDEDALTAKFIVANGAGEYHQNSFFESEGLKALHFEEHSENKSKATRRMLNVCGVGSAKRFSSSSSQSQSSMEHIEDIVKDIIPMIRAVNRAYQPRVLSKQPKQYCSDYLHYTTNAGEERMSDYLRWALWESTSNLAHLEQNGRQQKWKSSFNFGGGDSEMMMMKEKNMIYNSPLNNLLLKKQQTFQHKTERIALMDKTLHVHGETLSALPNPGYDLALAMADSGKLAALDKILDEKKAQGSRVLIFAQMTTMLDLLEFYLRARQHKFVRLDGQTKVSDRAAVVSGFQSDESIFVFMLSTRAGGLGINLTAADTVIFYESDWNPTVDQQAMDRAHRMGQMKTVHVYRLICQNTVEEYIAKTASDKSAVTDLVLKGSKKQADIERVNSLDDVNKEDGQAREQTTTEISKAEALKMLMEDKSDEDEGTKDRRERMQIKVAKAIELIRAKTNEVK
jgi:SNF2 family DNA or RNA helicase